jgi:hypothetical protein
VIGGRAREGASERGEIRKGEGVAVNRDRIGIGIGIGAVNRDVCEGRDGAR